MDRASRSRPAAMNPGPASASTRWPAASTTRSVRSANSARLSGAPRASLAPRESITAASAAPGIAPDRSAATTGPPTAPLPSTATRSTRCGSVTAAMSSGTRVGVALMPDTSFLGARREVLSFSDCVRSCVREPPGEVTGVGDAGHVLADLLGRRARGAPLVGELRGALPDPAQPAVLVDLGDLRGVLADQACGVGEIGEGVVAGAVPPGSPLGCDPGALEVADPAHEVVDRGH